MCDFCSVEKPTTEYDATWRGVDFKIDLCVDCFDYIKQQTLTYYQITKVLRRLKI